MNDETLETPVDGVYVVGDAQSGPSTIVRCIASARKSVEAAIDKVLGSYEEHDEHECDCDHEHEDGHECHCHDEEDEDDEEELSDEELDELIAAEDDFFSTIRSKKERIAKSIDPANIEAFSTRESIRCLECSYICNKCVDVCPNRANVAIDLRERNDLFDNPFQIVHIDAFCNECGNCGTFCPHQGNPFKDKLTIYNLSDDFENSTNSGFYINEDNEVIVRLDGKTQTLTVDKDGSLGEGLPEEVSAIIEEIMLNHSYLLGAVEL